MKLRGADQFTRVIPQIKCSLNQKCLDTLRELKKKETSEDNERENEENIDNEGLGDGEAEDAAADY